MGKTPFPHLHIHDDNSIKDGCATVETYADIAASLGGESLAVTNHGQASGFARQYFACKDRGIKPIFGMEAYINEHRTRPIKRLKEELVKADKRTRKLPAANYQIKSKLKALNRFIATRFRPSPHAIILAKNREGYRNLVRMATDSYQRGFYYNPRTDTTFLSEHREGLVYSTACIGGYIPKLAAANFDAGVEEAARLQKIFTTDGGAGFYVELMMTEYEKQRETNERMIKLATAIGAPCILTCDVHYAKPEDGDAQNALLLMRDKKTLADLEEQSYEAGDGGGGIWQFEAKDLYWRTTEDVVKCWREHHSDYMDKECFKEALRNTFLLADEIEDIEFDTSLKLPGVFDEPEFNLKEAVKRGMRYRVAKGQIPAPGKTLRDYSDRIKRELGVISGKGFAEYFLVLEDICEAARNMGARMGPGRGSAGGSLIAFLTQITEIDPLRFGLLFERFLDAGRDDPPDIDLDFSPEHRDGIKTYVDRKYPATATIGSTAVFKPRAVLGDVGRVYGVDYREMQVITKALGDDADDLTWDEIFDLWPQVQQFADDHPDAWGVVKTLRGLISHRTKNAAGMLIGPASALDEIPMIVERNKDGVAMTVTAFADSQGDGMLVKGRELTRLGYLKADLLGVRNLNIAPHAVEIVTRDTGVKIDFPSMPLDDPETLATASTGDVPGIFQLDSSTTRPIMKHVGVDNFADLVMITALCRPGPLKHQVHRQYAKLKRSNRWERDTMPELVPLLQDSRGLMILQEDVMFVFQAMSGGSMQQANLLRKIISKKHPEAMKEWKGMFVDGGVEKGLKRADLEETWAKIVTFAGYGFNKAHAVSYMLTAYYQLYMLTHHTIEYFAALLTHTQRGKKDQGGGERVVRYMRSAMARTIPILGPSVTRGGVEFDVTEDNEIRYGLGHVKSVAGASELIVAARPFKTLAEFYDRIERRRCNARVVQALIFSGAMDDIEFDRHAGGEVLPDLEGVERRNILLKRYRQLNPLKKGEEVPQFSAAVLRDKETELLGLPLSWWGSSTVRELREQEGLESIDYHAKNDVSRVHLLCEITKARIHKTKKKTTMAFLTVSDETGDLSNIVIWPSLYETYKRRIKPGAIVVMRLRRRESQNKEYGEWSYFLEEDSRHGEPIDTLARVMRQGAGSGEEE